jgi:hypothetical protein
VSARWTLPDAVLVHIAERDGLTKILSFDSDFSVYRLPAVGAAEVISSSFDEPAQRHVQVAEMGKTNNNSEFLASMST